MNGKWIRLENESAKAFLFLWFFVSEKERKPNMTTEQLYEMMGEGNLGYACVKNTMTIFLTKREPIRGNPKCVAYSEW